MNAFNSKSQPTKVRFKALTSLRNDDFRRFWFSSVGQSAGQGTQTLTIAWLVLELTGSISQLGLSVFAMGVPMSVMMIFGGVLADRVSRIKLIMASYLVSITLLALLGVLNVLGVAQVWHVYAVAPLIGAFQGLVRPASQTIISDLVDRSDVMNAVALNSTLMNVSQIAGPSIAGFIISGVGVGAALLVSASFYIVGIFWLSRIRNLPQPTRDNKTNPVKDLVNGVRYVRKVPPVFAIITIGCIMGLFAHPAQQMVPALVREEFNLGASAAGLLLMTAAIGGLIGNLTLAQLGDPKRKNWLLLWFGGLYGVAILLFAILPWYIGSMAALFLMGMGRTVFVSLGSTLLQLLIPRDYRGRALSWWGIGGSFMFVGAMPLGFLAEAVGLRLGIGLFVGVYMLSLAFVGFLKPTIRNLEPDQEAIPAPAGI